MKFRRLDVVVLERDLPVHGLKKGDLGAVVELYEPDGVEVEFVRVSGETQALLTLTVGDIRKIGYRDMLVARELAEVQT